MKIQCQCGAVYDVPESAGGKEVHCKKCGTKFVCPASPADSPLDVVDQPLPATFGGSPNAGKKRVPLPPSTRRKREDAILKKHMSVRSIRQERKRERRATAIEQDRAPNSVVSMICGGVAMASAVSLGVVLWNMSASPWGETSAVRNRKLLTILYFTGGKYWAPPLLFLIGLYFFVIGFLSYKRIINLEPFHYFYVLAEFASRRWWW